MDHDVPVPVNVSCQRELADMINDLWFCPEGIGQGQDEGQD